MLSDRRARVLAALIEEYVSCALPVGSRTLTERYHLGVSSATIRNELSRLEDEGYILQPHTSAGRVPTDAGYRAFVDKLLDSEDFHADARFKDVAQEMRESATELDNLFEQTSRKLMNLTDCLSIVLAPHVYASRIKHISLISLSSFRILLLIVTEDEQVINRPIDFDFPVDADSLAYIQRTLAEVVTGKTTHEVEESLREVMLEALSEPLIARILNEVLNCLHEESPRSGYRLGLSALMSQPEFEHSKTLLPVIRVLEDEAVLFELAEDVIHSEHNPTIRIGAENVCEELSGVSVVASKYGKENSEGVIAVIGPTRMDYSNVISAVRMARSVLESE